tara:strand:+ start:2897 stop:3091 length:195 start_codon:yes stop_codon:yes gene_type:complete
MEEINVIETKVEYKIRPLLEKLGYSFEKGQPPAYALALNLKKLGLDRDRLIQIVSLTYPIQINF